MAALQDGTWPRVEVLVDKDRYIYDRDMPQMSYEIDEVRVGDCLKGMVVEASQKVLWVTLQNSKIVGCRQEPMELPEGEPLIRKREKRQFHKLGIES